MELINPNKHKLSSADNEKIFNDDIVSYLFKDVARSEHPRAILVGGQPGAGKTVLQHRLKRDLEAEQPDASVSIIGDDLRPFHPLYQSLLDINDTAAAFYTDKDSGEWVGRSIDYAKHIGCSAIVEGTLRSHETVVNTATAFKEAGYSVELDIIVVPAILSRLGIVQRYLEQVRDTGVGRFTISAAHDKAYTAIPDTIAKVVDSDVIDEMRFHKRGGVVLRAFRPTQVLADDIQQAYLDIRNEPLDKNILHETKLMADLSESLAYEFEKTELIPLINELQSEIENMQSGNF